MDPIVLSSQWALVHIISWLTLRDNIEAFE